MMAIRSVAGHLDLLRRARRRLLSVTLAAIIAGAPLGEAAIRVEPKNIAVPCPPGTRFVFKRWVFGNELFSDTWTITAITKSGKTVQSGTFSSVDDSLEEPAEVAFT